MDLEGATRVAVPNSPGVYQTMDAWESGSAIHNWRHMTPYEVSATSTADHLLPVVPAAGVRLVLLGAAAVWTAAPAMNVGVQIRVQLPAVALLNKTADAGGTRSPVGPFSQVLAGTAPNTLMNLVGPYPICIATAASDGINAQISCQVSNPGTDPFTVYFWVAPLYSDSPC